MLRVWSALSEYPGPFRLDASRRSVCPLAPSDALRERTDASPERLAATYAAELVRARGRNPGFWDALMSASRLVIVDDSGRFRVLLAEFIRNTGPAIYHGELLEWDRTAEMERPAWAAYLDRRRAVLERIYAAKLRVALSLGLPVPPKPP